MGNGAGMEPGMGGWGCLKWITGTACAATTSPGPGLPMPGNNPTSARNNNGAGDHRYAREHTTNEQWDSGEQIPNEAPTLPTDDWITGGNPLVGGNGNNGGNPPNNNPPPGDNGGTPADDDGRPRRRNNGRTFLPQRRDIGTGTSTVR